MRLQNSGCHNLLFCHGRPIAATMILLFFLAAIGNDVVSPFGSTADVGRQQQRPIPSTTKPTTTTTTVSAAGTASKSTLFRNGPTSSRHSIATLQAVASTVTAEERRKRRIRNLLPYFDESFGMLILSQDGKMIVGRVENLQQQSHLVSFSVTFLPFWT